MKIGTKISEMSCDPCMITFQILIPSYKKSNTSIKEEKKNEEHAITSFK
jgi:hypothetical protein